MMCIGLRLAAITEQMPVLYIVFLFQHVHKPGQLLLPRLLFSCSNATSCMWPYAVMFFCDWNGPEHVHSCLYMYIHAKWTAYMVLGVSY